MPPPYAYPGPAYPNNGVGYTAVQPVNGYEVKQPNGGPVPRCIAVPVAPGLCGQAPSGPPTVSISVRV